MVLLKFSNFDKSSSSGFGDHLELILFFIEMSAIWSPNANLVFRLLSGLTDSLALLLRQPIKYI